MSHHQTPEHELLPRRLEIINVIRDHQMVSFDFIRRRFPGVPTSTLHYDLNQLRLQGYIHKKGKTRGVRYSSAQDLVNSNNSDLDNNLKIHQY